MENHILTHVSDVKRVRRLLGVAVFTFGIALCVCTGQRSPMPGSENFALGATARYVLGEASTVNLNQQLSDLAEQIVVPGLQVQIVPDFAKPVEGTLLQ